MIVLYCQGIACQQKGYILRGKITDPSGTAKLSFELEVEIVRIGVNTFSTMSVSRSAVFPTSTWWGSGERGSREMPGAIRRWEMEDITMIILIMFLKLTLPLKVCEEVLRLTAAGGPKGNC